MDTVDTLLVNVEKAIGEYSDEEWYALPFKKRDAIIMAEINKTRAERYERWTK